MKEAMTASCSKFVHEAFLVSYLCEYLQVPNLCVNLFMFQICGHVYWGEGGDKKYGANRV